MAKSCHCKKPNECEECPEWIFTFADLVMLMMGFFVILWVLKPAPNPKSSDGSKNDDWIKVAAAVRDAFGYIPDPKSHDPVDVAMIMLKLQRMKMNGPGNGGQTQVTPRGPEGTDPEVTTVRPGLFATDGGKM